MSRIATDILSVSQAAYALRIDDDLGTSEAPSEAAQELERSINAAVQYCERYADKPLTDRTTVYNVNRPAVSEYPLYVPTIYVKSVAGIRFWLTTQKLREEPSGAVLIAYADPDSPQDDEDPIGRIEAHRDRTAIWPPSNGWPAVLTDSSMVVTVVEGFPDATDANPDPIGGLDGVRKAVQVLTGINYEGMYISDTETNAVHRLLQPFVDARWQI